MSQSEWLHTGYHKHLIERLARISENGWDYFETAATTEEDSKTVAACIARMNGLVDSSIMSDLADFCDDTKTPELYDLFNVSKMIRDALLEPSPLQSPGARGEFKAKGATPKPH